MKKIFSSFVLGAFALLFINFPVFAHEQYVLTQKQIDEGFADKTTHVLSALNKPENLYTSIFVGVGITILAFVYFLFQNSKLGKNFSNKISKLEPLGHFFLRISLAASLIASAYFHAFLGPEIPVGSLPLGNILVPIEYAVGIMLLFGLFTRIASSVGLLILVMATFVYGEYMITYFNYYGEYIALIIFGSYVFSVDNKIFGVTKFIKKYKDLEIMLIRITYGISVLYPAITIKLLHPKVIVEIVDKYNLNSIHWLFPQDPLLISLGTGMAQILVGAFIIIGFETRLASFATFFLYIGSVIYFKEAVWPHYVLLALSFYFVINDGGKITLDNWIRKRGKHQS